MEELRQKIWGTTLQKTLKNCYSCNEVNVTDPCYKDCFAEFNYIAAYLTLAKNEYNECQGNKQCETKIMNKLQALN